MRTNVRSVLVITEHMNLGGRERYTFNLVRALHERGVKVALISRGGKMLGHLPKEIPVHVLPLARSGPIHRVAERRVYEIAEAMGAELIHAQTKTALVCADLAHEKLGIPVIDHEHHLYRTDRYPVVIAELSAHAEHVITTGPFMRGRLLEEGLDAARVTSVALGVSLTDYPKLAASERAEARARLGLTDADKAVLSVSRIVHGKGLMRLAEAFVEVAQAVPEAKLMIVGDVTDEDLKRELMQLRRTEKLSNRFRIYPGAFDVRRYLAAADVFSYPVIAKGLSVMEAMATSLPIVANVTNRKPVLVADGVEGLLTRSTSEHLIDPGEIAKKLTYLLTHPAQMRKMGKAARMKIEHGYSFEHHLDGVLKVYRQVLLSTAKGNLPARTAPKKAPKGLSLHGL